MKVWKASLNVDGVQSAGVESEDREFVINEILHYAFMYKEDTEDSMTITIRSKDSKDG